jgi:hypothetical protein
MDWSEDDSLNSQSRFFLIGFGESDRTIEIGHLWSEYSEKAISIDLAVEGIVDSLNLSEIAWLDDFLNLRWHLWRRLRWWVFSDHWNSPRNDPYLVCPVKQTLRNIVPDLFDLCRVTLFSVRAFH